MDKGETAPTKEEELQAKFEAAYDRVKRDRLPGWDDYLEATEATADWMKNQRAKVERAVRDEDEILLERALAGWEKGSAKINTAIAEKYRSENSDPEMWELRYVKWMKLKYIKFECPLGIFYIVPRQPSRSPSAQHWYTVDEMLDIIGTPSTAAAIKTFGQLPVRPSSLKKPEKGEKHLVVNYTGDDNPTLYYNIRGGIKRV